MAREKRKCTEEKVTSGDWGEIHQRLEASREAVEKGFSPSEKEKIKIFKARAKSLAREAEKEVSFEEYIEAVEFLVADERCAIESAFVREVYPLRQLTRLPHTPPFVLGIINVRGQILSVVDIKAFFGLPEKGLSDFSKVIIVNTDEMELGILADTVISSINIPIRQLQESLPTVTGIRAEYLKGITKERLVLLDVAKILSDERIIVHEEV